jgi:serine/threonine-protein kinase
VSQAEAIAEAARNATEASNRQRYDMSCEALSELDEIIKRLFDAIAHSADTVERDRAFARLGPAHLIFGEAGRSSLFGRTAEKAPDSGHGWDVVANAYLTLRCDLGGESYQQVSNYNFCTSLVFAKTPDDDAYRWREISFMQVFSSKPMHEQPIALNPHSGEFGTAMSNVIGAYQVACGPWTIDGEDEDEFQERWLRLFAKAAKRQLRPPTALPLPASFFA